MFRFTILVLFLSYFRLCQGENLVVFDFFGTGVKDNENIRFGALQINSDPQGPIQSEISICASLLLRAFTEEQSAFQVFDNQDIPWFAVFVSYFELETSLATIAFGVDGRYFPAIYLKVKPHGWIHACFGTNTRTGETRLSFNEQLFINDDLTTQFKDTTSRMPGDWTGKIVLGKWFYQDRWLQSLGAVTNLNMYRRLLSASEMIRITNSEDCRLDGDYLSWSQMDWDVTGEVERYDTSYAELCANNRKSYKFVLSHLQSWYECRANCPMYKGSYMASAPDRATDEFNKNWIMKRMFEMKVDNNNLTILTPFLGGCYRLILSSLSSSLGVLHFKVLAPDQ